MQLRYFQVADNRRCPHDRKKVEKYTREFKLQAIPLAESHNGSVAEVVRNLGITPNMLYRWIRELNADNQHAFPGLGKLKSLDEELRQLRKKLADTKMERDI